MKGSIFRVKNPVRKGFRFRTTDPEKLGLPPQSVWLPWMRALAERFNVALEHAEGKEFVKLNGPGGNAGMRIPERIVWYCDEAQHFHVLHEIMHIVTTPPGIDHEIVSEDLVLLQYERCVARALGADVYIPVVVWQHETIAPLIVPEAALHEIQSYAWTRPWHDGFAFARRLGLLNRWNRPTWRLPTWTDDLLEEARLKVKEVSGG